MNPGTFGIPSGVAAGAVASGRLSRVLRAPPLAVANLSSVAALAGAVVDTRSLAADLSTVQTVVRITGPGVLGWLGLHNGSGISGSARCRVVIDGEVVLDLAGSCPSGSGLCFVGFGHYDTAPSLGRCELPFTRELVLQVASSGGGAHSTLYQAELYT